MRPLVELATLITLALLAIGLPLMILYRVVEWVGSVVGVW